MISRDMYQTIQLEGLFSEYLPPCFKLDEEMLELEPCKGSDSIPPYSFTMSRFTANEARRTLSIPEIGAYLALNQYMKNNNIIEELLEFIENNPVSFSKVIMNDGSIVKHDQVYGGDETGDTEVKSQYINNTVKKIILSAGAKKVLKLDIANCYSSLYTHYIPAILLGYESANEEYKKDLKKKAGDTYKKYKRLDAKIRQQNLNQTNGLLVGPIVSRIIVEGILTRIDKELKDREVLYSRYVDDYEVYLFDDDTERVKSLFIAVLKKYGFSLNYEKTEVIDFPYYVVSNFDKIIDAYRENVGDDYDLIKIFNDFFAIEKSGTKGAIRYLLKSLEKSPIECDNKQLLNSYILTVMSNDSRSLTRACSVLIKNHQDTGMSSDYIKVLKRLLMINLERDYDLEVIWLLYALIETRNLAKDDNVVNAIVNGNNELAKLMLLRKGLVSSDAIERIKDSAKSWLLNYELYAYGSLMEDELFERLAIKNYKELYKELKNKGLHFCYQSNEDRGESVTVS